MTGIYYLACLYINLRRSRDCMWKSVGMWMFAPTHRGMGWGEGAGGLTNISIFSTVHEMSQTFETFPIKLPTPGEVGVNFCITFLGSS